MHILCKERYTAVVGISLLFYIKKDFKMYIVLGHIGLHLKVSHRF